MEQKRSIAIVVIAYNRPNALKRILGSLAKAVYGDRQDIPLVISIDKSDNNTVVQVAEEFEWAFGHKEVIAQPERLGLKKHVISCGDLTEKYGQVLILEDDLYVSPFFYAYTLKASDKYNTEDNIAGIGLYSYDFNELARQPFRPLDDGFDTYFMQIPCSLGQVWTQKQWGAFKQYLVTNPGPLKTTAKLSNTIIHQWPESSWKKLFYHYMVQQNKFFVYPRNSYTTNFGDIGSHYHEPTGSFQVALNLGNRKLYFAPWEDSLAKYDAWFEILPDVLKLLNPKLKEFDFEVDLNGIKEPDKIESKYLLSARKCNTPLLTFAAQMIPHESNVVQGIEGDFFSLAETKQFKLSVNRLNRFHPYYSKTNINALVDANWFRLFAGFVYRKVKSLFGSK